MHGCERTLNGGWRLVDSCLGWTRCVYIGAHACACICVGVSLSHAGGVSDAEALDRLDIGAESQSSVETRQRVGTEAAGGDPYLRHDRYTLVRGAARPDQRQPLDATLRIAFGGDIRTIGQATAELLVRSGYRLTYSDQENCLLVRELLFRQPLPASLRDFGPVPLLSGFDALIGTAWGVRVNELGRTLQLYIHSGYRDEQWLQRFLEALHSAEATGSQQWFVPFALAEFRTLGEVAHRVIQQAADVVLTQELQLVLRGHSHSHAGWATEEQARRRAQTVAVALEQHGVQRRQIAVETHVSNHQDTAAALRHGVEIELRNPQVAEREVACRTLPPVSRDTADSSERVGHFAVRQGSLKANVQRLLERFSLRVGQWHLLDGDYEYDWDIPYEYQVPAPDAEQALSALLESYDIQPTLNLRDRTVDFAPRYTPRRDGTRE